MAPRPFKAIIVGGSVAGLTLAHVLSCAKIDYVLLEARDTISPQIGASIVIMPNGARILDQMGLYDELKDRIMTPMARTFTRGEGGNLVGSNDWPRLVEERLGYICGICERMKFLKSIYGQLKDKSKVRLGKKVCEVKHGVDSVTVRCEDGTEFEGDVVIGADGIHSRARREMQRYARETGPPGLMDGDENCITAEYNCIFGISAPISSLTAGDSHTTLALDHSSLLFVSANSLPQFFFVSKLPKKAIGTSSIPRFTTSQMKSQVEEFADFKVTDTVTLGQLTSNTALKKLSWFSLEEANHTHWTYGRIVCIGDAIHKMTPNLGQGGNQAIESAAVLGNILVELLASQKEGKVAIEELQKSLKTFEGMRKERSQKFVDFSGQVTRNDALQGLKHVLRFLYFDPLDGEAMAGIQTEMYHTAPFLNFLPMPERTKDNEWWIRGKKRINAGRDVPFSAKARKEGVRAKL